ncbi:hypothetical protein ABT158_17735 [Nonomuraea sp. NPDC001636]|uniref:nSTAND1 domain-containing NTPase n=1 Tax=Nonomuraea sp. NPDC001636 TaxID=3154391 RepID=UPI00332BE4E4
MITFTWLGALCWFARIRGYGGGGDAERWRARWEEALTAARGATGSGGDAARSPYRGPARFETTDQAYFFGRTALVERVAELVEAHRLVVVVGRPTCGRDAR